MSLDSFKIRTQNANHLLQILSPLFRRHFVRTQVLANMFFQNLKPVSYIPMVVCCGFEGDVNLEAIRLASIKQQLISLKTVGHGH
ncbi:putative protein OS=Eoetvoesiella caeni OX=645616 GN=DFR37_11663 PE=4 SV=1 [Eoetvoesiella caeni]|uniref:Uncharacterized protein n=1 Tax=Eoetvoesiella caeni TaxID=645616 RepID=A0A366H2X6_9BURK|nr:hypothetical protein DFR37_11663 [Eoetvoesiella caeni]